MDSLSIAKLILTAWNSHGKFGTEGFGWVFVRDLLSVVILHSDMDIDDIECDFSDTTNEELAGVSVLDCVWFLM